ncbi:MAG: methyltransferase domain-containing protein [Candidatus Latescibacterota bacterium]|nr:methyltransferase domain-containing protein [Candidatus Latescibacterota bacterium]
MLTRTEISEIAQHSRKLVGDLALTEMAVPSYTHSNPLVRWIIKERLRQIATLIRSAGYRRILDFGCGLGLLAHELKSDVDCLFLVDVEPAPARFVVDYFEISNARVLTPHEAAVVPDHEVDCVVAADVLEHFASNEELIAQLRVLQGKLRPSGVLLLSGPTENGAYRFARKIAGFTGGYHHRDVYDIENTLAENSWAPAGHRSALPSWSPVKLFRVSGWRAPAQ